MLPPTVEVADAGVSDFGAAVAVAVGSGVGKVLATGEGDGVGVGLLCPVQPTETTIVTNVKTSPRIRKRFVLGIASLPRRMLACYQPKPPGFPVRRGSALKLRVGSTRA